MTVKKDPLYYLIIISKCNSMNIAAEQLFISQPALSMSIKKLEHELGITLLQRASNGVTLTSVGEKIVAIAEEIMMLYQEIDDIILQETETNLLVPMGHLTIYCPYSINQAALSFHLNELCTITDSFDIITRAINLDDLSLYFGQNENEIVLTIFPTASTDLRHLPSDMRYQIISVTKIHLLAGQNHPLVQKQTKSIALKDILAYPIINHKNGFCPQSVALDLLSTYGTPNIAAETYDSRFYINMIASGKVVGLAPKSLFSFIQPSDPVVWIPLQETIKTSFAIFYKNDLNPVLLQHLMVLLKKITATL